MRGGVPDLLQQFEATAGMLIDLPSGIVHALGEGVLVAEVQTASDTTFRVYDWGREDREIHIEQAMICVRENPHIRARVVAPADNTPLANAHYSLHSNTIDSNAELVIEASDVCSICMVTQGSGTLHSCAEPSPPSTPLSKGQTLLVPAGWHGTITPSDSGASVLIARVG